MKKPRVLVVDDEEDFDSDESEDADDEEGK